MIRDFRAGRERKAAGRPGIDLIHGRARLSGPREVTVGHRTLQSERIFINTGTRPAIPPLEGLDSVDYLTNATIMELDALPEHLLVLGGGYVGLEFGQMFRH